MIGFARSMASARSLSQFQKTFSDEASCAAFMFKRRWPGGFVSPAAANAGWPRYTAGRVCTSALIADGKPLSSERIHVKARAGRDRLLYYI